MKHKEKLLKIHKYLYHSALKQLRTIILFSPAGIFLIGFFLLAFITESVNLDRRKLLLPNPVFSDFRLSEYPTLQYEITDASANITAEGAIIMDADTKKVLYAKNPLQKFSMASSTKIMTALVGLERYRSDAILTVKSGNVPPAIVGYPVGEKVAFMNMLYGMMLPSGNDAALAIAQNYSGGSTAFIREMNQKAKDLALFNTQFVDSSGLDDSNYTTVVDLARLAAHALKNDVFKEVVASKEKNTVNASGTKKYHVANLNELLGKYGVTGIKTGFTPNAGGILVTSSVQNGHTVIIVVMKSNDRFGDTERLLALLKNNITYVAILP